MIDVRELLTLKTFKDFVLVTGESGLNRRVTWPNIAQTVSIREWLVGGDVILMTGVGLSINDEFLTNIVHQAVEGKAACLIILIKEEYIKRIPKETVEFAEKNNFPLFEAPWDTKISNVIRDVSKLVSNDEYEEKLRNIFWQRVMAGSLDIADQYNKNILEKYKLDRKYTVMVVRNLAYEQKNSAFFSKCSSYIVSESRIFLGRNFNVVKEQDVILAIVGISQKELQNKAVQLADKIGKEFPTVQFKIGIGSSEESPEHLCDSFHKAVSALKAQKESLVTSYGDLGIYQLLLELPDQNLLKKYVDENIGALLKYDEEYKQELILTLRIFLDMNGSITRTSEKLFIHRNTLLKRTAKIEEILGVSLKDALVRNRCYNCLKIYDYM